ncbi:MAG TPA: HD domain-containing phosphohydrolase [Spirochaetota bacterium]|nr:HD domain-containing phosphohydrolase [Spirochaetota bacterium]HOL57206.1 HD domain-containing phosphohydrolase [Spirochaetota bacterium]HPP04843.1 HD domain-containing phosphohydrolase [Spirochaetota bacterium]
MSSSDKTIVPINIFNELKSRYKSLHRNFTIVGSALKKSRIAFKRLLRDYIILKKRYIILKKYSTKKVNELIEKINIENFELIFDHNRRLLKVSEKFLEEIEMDQNEFAQSFYVDILFEKFLPQPVKKDFNEKGEIIIEDFQFPIMIKNYQFEDETHIHPYIYFKMSGKLKFDQKSKLFLYFLNAENISSSVELAYFQKTDSLITTLSITNFNLLKAKKTIEMHKIMLIFLTCSIIEPFNKETSMHLEKIRTITTYLTAECKRLGLIKPDNYDVEEYIKDINYTSVLHDIGKVGIPQELLTKETPLTEEEKAIVRQHTKIGAEYIHKIIRVLFEDPQYSLYVDFLRVPYEICLYHHERWDGKGYPEGLSGEEIPISARIVSVADTYDAIRANRAYDASRSHKEAMEIIKRESGKQFDPKIVEAFLNISHILEQIDY